MYLPLFTGGFCGGGRRDVSLLENWGEVPPLWKIGVCPPPLGKISPPILILKKVEKCTVKNSRGV